MRRRRPPESPTRRPAGRPSSGKGQDNQGSAQALHLKWVEIALVLFLSFELMLRSSEAPNLKLGDIVFTRQDVALFKWGFAKGGLRNGRKKAEVLDKEVLDRRLKTIHDPADPGKLIISPG